MKIEYSLTEDDFLTHQLYAATNTPRIVRQRKRAWLLVPALYILIAVVLYWEGLKPTALFLAVAAIVWLPLYPVFQRNRYRKHFLNTVRDSYKNRINKPGSVEFTDGLILMKDDTGESKMNIDQVEKITELPHHILVKLKAGVTIILPKDKMRDYEGVVAYLKALASQLGIPYNPELDWRWK
ncbi:MAG: YcxB family protein [Chitinophagales bacterium]